MVFNYLNDPLKNTEGEDAATDAGELMAIPIATLLDDDGSPRMSGSPRSDRFHSAIESLAADSLFPRSPLRSDTTTSLVQDRDNDIAWRHSRDNYARTLDELLNGDDLPFLDAFFM